MLNGKIKIIVSISVFCVLFVCTGMFLGFISTDDSNSYTRVALHEMYEQDNIDVLFVGSSHCYRSFVPEILDNRLRQNTFNAGSSSQLMDGSLMLIKEAAKYNDIKHIYLEVYFWCAFDVKEQRKQLTSTYIIADYLEPSVDKYEYLLNATTSEHYANSFILARRNWPKLLKWDYLLKTFIKKNTDSYKNYSYKYITSDKEWYVGKGYVANSGIVRDWNYFSRKDLKPFRAADVSEDWKNDLELIMDFCDEKQIPLTLIAAPMPNFFIAGVGNYDEYIQCVKEIIAGRNVDYYDFNLCKEKYFPNTSELFKDEDHLNDQGAKLFSKIFASLVNGEVRPQEMFHKSFKEKLESIPATVFGVSYKDYKLADKSLTRACRIITNDAGNFEYEISIKPAKGETYVLSNYSPAVTFQMPPLKKGTCILRYRRIGDKASPREIKLSMP